MFVRNSRYSRLQGRKDISEKEYYEGTFHGQNIRLNRNFRGYRFSDAECEALCHGEWLEVHNLENNGVLYGVCGTLEKDMFQNEESSDIVPVYVFKSKFTRVNNPNYSFEQRVPYYGPDVSSNNVPSKTNVNAEDIVLLSDAFSDDVDAKLAALIAAPDLPAIQKVEVSDNNVPVYVPVLNNMAITKDGIVAVEETPSVLNELTDATVHIDYVSHDVEFEEGLGVDEEDIIDMDSNDIDVDMDDEDVPFGYDSSDVNDNSSNDDEDVVIM